MDLEELKQIITQEIEKEVEKTIKNLCEKYNLNVEEASKFIMKKEVKRGRPAKEEDPEEIKDIFYETFGIDADDTEKLPEAILNLIINP